MRWVLVVAVLAACEPPGYHKHDVDAAVDGDRGDAGPDATPDGPATCNPMFQLDGHGAAASVWLTGDFVAWGADPDHGAIAFTLVAASWVGSHQFSAGSYQYKFIVDGSMWIADPTNPNVIDDGFGGHNSVFDCMP